ncbi:hypothetical protein Tco_0644432 [Tanacetum coccineum]
MGMCQMQTCLGDYLFSSAGYGGLVRRLECWRVGVGVGGDELSRGVVYVLVIRGERVCGCQVGAVVEDWAFARVYGENADETVYKEWEDRMEIAATIASRLEAEQDSGYHIRGAEAQSRFEAASKQSNDPPLLRVNTLGSGEDNMKLMELMEHCTKL